MTNRLQSYHQSLGQERLNMCQHSIRQDFGNRECKTQIFPKSGSACKKCSPLNWGKSLPDFSMFRTGKIAVLPVPINGYQVKDSVDHGIWHGNAIYYMLQSLSGM